MNKTRMVMVISAFMLLLAACGGQSAEEALLEEILENSEGIGDIDIDTGGGGDGDFSINIQGEDGEDISFSGSGDDEDFQFTVEGEDGETMSFGGGEIPEELSVPVPDGGEVTMSLTSDQDISVALQYPQNEFDRIVSFYDETFDSDSDSVDRYESSYSTEDGTVRSVNWNESGYGWTVTVSDCFSGASGEMDAICVTVYQTGS